MSTAGVDTDGASTAGLDADSVSTAGLDADGVSTAGVDADGVSTAGVDADGVSARLTAGDRAPSLSLEGTDGHVDLASLAGRQVVVYFFPKAFSPVCTGQVCTYRDELPRFTEAGAEVFGISPDPVDELRRFADQFSLGHALLSDPDATTAKRWGAWGPKTVDGQHMVGLLRSTFVVGTDGVLESADYEVDGSTDAAAAAAVTAH